MKTVRNIIWAMIATMSAFWFAMEPQLFASSDVFEWRSAMIQYSGIFVSDVNVHHHDFGDAFTHG